MKVSTRNIKIIKDRLEILNKRFNILPSSEDIRISDETFLSISPMMSLTIHTITLMIFYVTLMT